MDIQRCNMKKELFLILKVIGAICVVRAVEIIAPLERLGLFRVF